jgi:hypothetical protein
VKAGVSVQAVLVAIRCKVTKSVQFKAEAREYIEYKYGVKVSADSIASFLNTQHGLYCKRNSGRASFGLPCLEIGASLSQKNHFISIFIRIYDKILVWIYRFIASYKIRMVVVEGKAQILGP